MSNTERDDTVEVIRDELDNYGGHLRVFLEDREGNLYEVGEITARPNWNGELVVTIAAGEPSRP
jgi:hypothetical protein